MRGRSAGNGREEETRARTGWGFDIIRLVVSPEAASVLFGSSELYGSFTSHQVKRPATETKTNTPRVTSRGNGGRGTRTQSVKEVLDALAISGREYERKPLTAYSPSYSLPNLTLSLRWLLQP